MKEFYPYAFVTFLIKNDSYLPGALLQAYSLKKQAIIADTICIVTEEIPDQAISALKIVFDKVIQLESIKTSQLKDQKRQYLSRIFTRLHALRLGGDGDLGCSYSKIIVMDADILPIRGYQQLFLVDSPGGILNEYKEYVISDIKLEDRLNGVWTWHKHYRNIPHGCRIPKSITDNVIFDRNNYGINTALLIIEPSMDIYNEIIADLENEKIINFIKCNFKWPDMQYLTLKWSGLWHNVDLSYASFHGYPDIEVINGNHYAGIKPWQIYNDSVTRKYRYHDDFRYWYREFTNMMNENEELNIHKKLNRIKKESLEADEKILK